MLEGEKGVARRENLWYPRGRRSLSVEGTQKWHVLAKGKEQDFRLRILWQPGAPKKVAVFKDDNLRVDSDASQSLVKDEIYYEPELDILSRSGVNRPYYEFACKL